MPPIMTAMRYHGILSYPFCMLTRFSKLPSLSAFRTDSLPAVKWIVSKCDASHLLTILDASLRTEAEFKQKCILSFIIHSLKTGKWNKPSNRTWLRLSAHLVETAFMLSSYCDRCRCKRGFDLRKNACFVCFIDLICEGFAYLKTFNLQITLFNGLIYVPTATTTYLDSYSPKFKTANK